MQLLSFKFILSLGELTRSEPDVEDGKDSQDATLENLGIITETITTVQDDNVKTTKLATEDSTKDTKLSPTVANDNTVVCYVCHVSLPTKHAPQSGKGSSEVHYRTLGSNVVKDEKSFLEILDEPVTESVAIPDDQIQQVEKEACTKDVAECTIKLSKEEGDYQSSVAADIPAKFVPGDNVVDTRENEALTTEFNESTVNVSEAGDSQSVVIPDTRTTFVPDDDVVDGIQGNSQQQRF